MTDWTDGYVADLNYIYGYYNELNPLRLRLAFLSAGLHFPEVGTACELGFGQGVGINLHAAASVVSWYGTDFNPSQANFAGELAHASKAHVQLFDQAFAEFCTRTDLPDFDFIALHGIWSWISEDNREVIVDFLRRKLKLGGVVYLSYNTQPGWASMIPVHGLLKEHARVMGNSGQGLVSSLSAAFDFTEKLLVTNPVFARANPQVIEKIKQFRQHDYHYLVHEFFNRDWLPMPFSEVQSTLATAKLSFACSAHYLDHIDQVNLTAEQQALLAEIPDPLFRQTVRDFCVNQQFRRDYWVKGARPLHQLEQLEALRTLRVVLLKSRSDIVLDKVSGAVLGDFALQESIYAPILNALVEHQPKTLAQVEQAVIIEGISFSQLLQAVLVLSHMGAIATAQEDEVIEQSKKHTDQLNAYLCYKARSAGDIQYLASPVTGGGISVSRFSSLFLLGYTQGKKQCDELAHYVWSILSLQNQLILKEGKTLEGADDNIAELNVQATAFIEKELPILTALGISW